MAHARRAIAALLLGAIASVLIAWGIDFSYQHRKPKSAGTQLRVEPNLSPSPNWMWFVTPDQRVGHRLYTFRAGRIASDRSKAMASALDVVEIDDLPHWVCVPASGMYLESHGIGFPLPCLARQNIHASVPRDFIAVNVLGNRRLLATRPIWTGLLVNALILGLLLYPLTLIPFVIARRKRRTRGQCVSCAYDLRGAAHVRCPECGSTCR